MTGDGENFTSPNYPKSYPVDSECIWTIVTTPEDTIELKFHDFHLENTGACRFDFVEIRQGGTRYSPLIGKFCASTIISPINSTGNSLFIRLVSDGTVSEKGFRATWRRISHKTPTTPTIRVSTTPTLAKGKQRCSYVVLFNTSALSLDWSDSTHCLSYQRDCRFRKSGVCCQEQNVSPRVKHSVITSRSYRH